MNDDVSLEDDTVFYVGADLTFHSIDDLMEFARAYIDSVEKDSDD